MKEKWLPCVAANGILFRGVADKNKHVTIDRHPTHKRTPTNDDCAVRSQARRPQPPASLFRAFALSEVCAARIYVAMAPKRRAGKHPKAVKGFIDHVGADNITREQLDDVDDVGAKLRSKAFGAYGAHLNNNHSEE